jgi:hypothetical protein
MARHRLLGCVALVAVGFFFFFAAPAVADEPDITGKYNCEGTNPAGKLYRGTVTIAKKGDAYYLKWSLNAGDTYAGIGIREGNVLAVSYYGGISGVVVYRIEKGNKLVGKWTIADAKGKVYTETLGR